MGLVAFLSCICALTLSIHALDNGLALTPPMGWLAWERYRCQLDCKDYPDDCISEKLFMRMADELVSGGYRDVGYVYVNIDDCWLAKTRDAQGKLQADPDRFPNGITFLSKYMHARGLKLGIYEDFGTATCAGFPGSEFYLQLDANTFAEWEVDMLKFDGCNSAVSDMKYGYPIMGHFLNATGRPILYSCSWPAYVEFAKIMPDYVQIAKTCNIWRNWADIDDSWASVQGIINFYAADHSKFREVAGPGNFNDPDMVSYELVREACNMWRNYWDVGDSWDSLQDIINYIAANKYNYSLYAGPGGWNDPDMLIVGDYGLSYDQQRTQLAIWAIMASPFFMSLDLVKIRPESKALILNRNIIAVNQDKQGIQGIMLAKINNHQLWTRPILPTGTLTFAVVNFNQGGGPSKVELTLGGLGLTDPKGYAVTEVFDGTKMGNFTLTTNVSFSVNPTGVFIAMAVPLAGPQKELVQQSEMNKDTKLYFRRQRDAMHDNIIYFK